MLDVVWKVSEAWEEVEPITLIRSWRKFIDHEAGQCKADVDQSKQGETTEDSHLLSLLRKIPGCENVDRKDMEEWIFADNDFEFTDEDILQLVRQEQQPTEGNSPDDDEEGSSSFSDMITHAEGFEILERACAYLEQQDDYTAQDGILFRKWRDYAAPRCITKSKQTSIETFLKK